MFSKCKNRKKQIEAKTNLDRIHIINLYSAVNIDS